MPLAREFGLGLQTVNVIRGIREDFDRGWVYIPKKFILDMGLTKEQLFDPEHREQALKVLDMMTDKAERHLRQALQYVKSLPWWQHGIRLGCIFPLMFASRTLAVCRHNAQVFESQAKMSRCPFTMFTQYTQGMSIVHHDGGLVFLSQFNDARQVGDVTLHGEDTINHD